MQRERERLAERERKREIERLAESERERGERERLAPSHDQRGGLFLRSEREHEASDRARHAR